MMPPAPPDPLLPADALAAWLDEVGIAPGAPIKIEPLRGGMTNVMYRVERGGRRIVIRRPAARAVDRADDGMRREFRILRALGATAVPHPAAIAISDDRQRFDCVLYAMEDVDGISAVDLPPALAPRAVTDAVVDALALLHEVDVEGVGLADLGHTEDFHERQVSRWAAQHEREGGRDRDRLAAVGCWLEANLPDQWSPALMHGDYHMFNVIVAPQPPARVTAIVDWETATVGDPLLDLAGFCEVWTSAFSADPWPTCDEIVGRYVARRGLATVPELRYYATLHNFRMAVLLEGVYQRSLRDDRRPDNEVAGQRALVNLRRAEELSEV
jgi:aminoglycoside phosphotransferase (APT) family kinase protein